MLTPVTGLVRETFLNISKLSEFIALGPELSLNNHFDSFSTNSCLALLEDLPAGPDGAAANLDFSRYSFCSLTSPGERVKSCDNEFGNF